MSKGPLTTEAYIYSESNSKTYYRALKNWFLLTDSSKGQAYTKQITLQDCTFTVL